MASRGVIHRRPAFEFRENRKPKAIVAVAPIKMGRQCAVSCGSRRVRPIDIESCFGRLIRVRKIPKR